MSVYGISVAGLMAQSRKVDGIARDIANLNSNALPDSKGNIPVDVVSLSSSAMPLEDGLIGLNQAKIASQADIKVIQTQREMDKALLDIIT